MQKKQPPRGATSPQVHIPRRDLRQAAGQSIIFGFRGTTLSSELKELLREVRPLGLIFFARNIESPAQLADLSAELKAWRADEPLLLCLDHEGGRVMRVPQPATLWPPMAHLGALEAIEHSAPAQPNNPIIERVAQAMASELRAMNIDVNFAPVLDVATNPDNKVIGDRAFASTPEQVARCGARFIRALQAHGVAACGKHFPGHGDTLLDSHHALPYVDHELARLRAVEWMPFRAAIAARVGAIMTAHVVVNCLDQVLPATLSSKALAPLRHELGFHGVIISDDLEMRAVAAHFSPAQMAELGKTAGVDVFLACHEPEFILALYRGLVISAENKSIAHTTLQASAQRITQWRDTYFRPAALPSAVNAAVGSQPHAALLAEIRRP